ESDRALHRKRPFALEQVAEVSAVHVLADEERGPAVRSHVEEAREGGMRDQRDRPGLARQALGEHRVVREGGLEQSNDHPPRKLGVGRPPRAAVDPVTELLVQDVPPREHGVGPLGPHRPSLASRRGRTTRSEGRRASRPGADRLREVLQEADPSGEQGGGPLGDRDRHVPRDRVEDEPVPRQLGPRDLLLDLVEGGRLGIVDVVRRLVDGGGLEGGVAGRARDLVAHQQDRARIPGGEEEHDEQGEPDEHDLAHEPALLAQTLGRPHRVHLVVSCRLITSTSSSRTISAESTKASNPATTDPDTWTTCALTVAVPRAWPIVRATTQATAAVAPEAIEVRTMLAAMRRPSRW